MEQEKGRWDQKSLAACLASGTKTIYLLLGLYCGRSEAEGLLVHLVLVSRVAQPGILKFSDDKAET